MTKRSEETSTHHEVRDALTPDGLRARLHERLSVLTHALLLGIVHILSGKNRQWLGLLCMGGAQIYLKSPLCSKCAFSFWSPSPARLLSICIARCTSPCPVQRCWAFNPSMQCALMVDTFRPRHHASRPSAPHFLIPFFHLLAVNFPLNEGYTLPIYSRDGCGSCILVAETHRPPAPVSMAPPKGPGRPQRGVCLRGLPHENSPGHLSALRSLPTALTWARSITAEPFSCMLRGIILPTRAEAMAPFWLRRGSTLGATAEEKHVSDQRNGLAQGSKNAGAKIGMGGSAH